jgi:lysophospholipase L1-like esterase
MTKILIFGDSIAWGAFDKKYGGWVERLKAHFLQNYKEEEIGIYNLSISSNDTRGVLVFLEQDINKINKIEPEKLILLFSIGSNDSRYINEKNNVAVPIKEFEENLKKIITISNKFSPKIFFTGLIKVDDKLTQPWNQNEFWENKDIQKYDDTIRTICKNQQIDFISLFDLIEKNELKDGLHPNTKGHEKIFNHVKEYLLKTI